MATATEGRRLRSAAIGLPLVLALVACSATPATSTPEAATSPATSASSASPATEPPASNVPAGHPGPDLELPELGRPYGAADILEIMAASRRPGGLPDRLQTDAVAAQVADAIWTHRGAPWVTSTAGGHCGPSVCTLELAGTLDRGAGEDLWVFEVAGGEVTLVTADLRALPPDLLDELDAIARAVEPEIGRRDLALRTVAWLLPPQDGRFRLSYRSGGEEGSCRMEVTVDATDGALAAAESTHC